MAERHQKGTRRQQGKRYYEGNERIDGPGVFATCVRGKEKQTVSELYDVFESFAADLWPDDEIGGGREEEDPPELEEEESIEDQITRELENLKKPRKEKRFSSVNTLTTCLVFISCRPPVEPVKLVRAYLEDIERKKMAQTRYVHRLVPAADTCSANLPDILDMARRLLPLTFEQTERTYRYKIEISIINHSKLKKDEIIPPLAKCVPDDKGHVVDLKHPDVVILVQIFKKACGMSIVTDYERFRKFNVIQLAEENKPQIEAEVEMEAGQHA